MPIDNSSQIPLLRLLQLVSPSLPTGGFAYSQGLEFAVENKWVQNVLDVEEWLSGLLYGSITWLEIPILRRLYTAIEHEDLKSFQYWSALLFASRETSELRQEEQNKARALNRLIRELGVKKEAEWDDALHKNMLCPFTLAAVAWSIPIHHTAIGYVWGTLENHVASAIKLVPLGQTEGQSLLFRIAESIPSAVAKGLKRSDEVIGSSTPAVAIASSLHETQYTRLFRS